MNRLYGIVGHLLFNCGDSLFAYFLLLPDLLQPVFDFPVGFADSILGQ